MILETERLALRELDQSDFAALRAILQDEQVMYAYEHAFTNREVQAWLDRQRDRYAKDGFGLWAMVEKATGEMLCRRGRHRLPGVRLPEPGHGGGLFHHP